MRYFFCGICSFLLAITCEGTCIIVTTAAVWAFAHFLCRLPAFGSRGWISPSFIKTPPRQATIRFGGLERIKFKIYPDGRVEETVIGIKGEECLKVTEEINDKLGKVVSTQNTEEMMEQPVTDQNKVYESNKAQWWMVKTAALLPYFAEEVETSSTDRRKTFAS